MKIAILDDYANKALTLANWDSIDSAEITVFNDTITDINALVERISPFEIICIMRERTPFPKQLLDSLPNLKLLITTGPRNLSIDLDAAAANGVTVCSTESRKTTTSELSMLLILALTRNLVTEVKSMQTTGWQQDLGRDLHGLNLGLIGLGKIGAQMATIASAFGMNTHAWSPNLTHDRCDECGVTHHSTIESLMSESDVVSVHMVLSDKTHHLIGESAFAAMRKRALFVNTSRGPLADTQALLNGLRVGKPWKAALDVFDEEPLPGNHPLRDEALIQSGKLLLSPHLGYATEQTFKIFYTQTVEAILAWQAGNPIRVLA